VIKQLWIRSNASPVLSGRRFSYFRSLACAFQPSAIFGTHRVEAVQGWRMHGSRRPSRSSLTNNVPLPVVSFYMPCRIFRCSSRLTARAPQLIAFPLASESLLYFKISFTVRAHNTGMGWGHTRSAAHSLSSLNSDDLNDVDESVADSQGKVVGYKESAQRIG
jgi:hypothetical protein